MSAAVGILLAAGSSARMGFPKLTARLPGGETPLSLAVRGLLEGGVDAMVFVTGEDTKDAAALAADMLPIPCTCVPGGKTRQESVRLGLAAAALFQPEVAAIHDAARCMATGALIRACIAAARETGSGIAAIPAQDTILQRDGARIVSLPREQLLATQTPQAFAFREILAAHARAAESGETATDCATLYARYLEEKRPGRTPTFVPSSEENFKLTTPQDFVRLTSLLASPALRIGTGEDMHRLVPGRRLILGGVDIPFDRGLLGHSDGDALAHAALDAVFGAAGLPDIGQRFPDTDPALKDANSMGLLAAGMEDVRRAGYALVNLDATIIAERPKLASHIPAMRDALARALGVSAAQVNIKATTSEGLGPEGEGRAIRATAVALLQKH